MLRRANTGFAVEEKEEREKQSIGCIDATTGKILKRPKLADGKTFEPEAHLIRLLAQV
jgi:hypothetical protein